MNEDVKLLLEGLKFCRSHEFCDGCPLKKKCLDKDSDFDIVGASADQIEALAAEIEVVLSKLEKATRERDAAIEEMRLVASNCEQCKHYTPELCEKYMVQPSDVRRRLFGCWKWRGPKEG